MADNVNITQGAGKVIAADDVGGVMFQRVKIAHGVDGAAADVSTSDPLPISNINLPPNAATQVTLAAVLAALAPPIAVTSTPAVIATATLSQVASSATSGQLLAANASRKGAMIQNTDTNNLYLKFGTTASLTSFTVRIPQNGYYELPQPVYTGRIDGIWDIDGSGSAVMTELT